jgi:phytoene dehydrogenase-like protein
MVDHDEFLCVEGTNGKAFVLYTDADRLEQHLKALAPADSEVIEELCE